MRGELFTLQDLNDLSLGMFDLYQTSSHHEFASVAVTILQRLIAVDNIHHVTMQPGKGFCFLATSHPDVQDSFIRLLPVLTDYHQRFPEITQTVAAKIKAGGVHLMSNDVSSSFARSSGYLDDFAEKIYSTNQLYFAFKTTDGSMPLVSCNRNGANFSEREQALLAFIAPHLQAAYFNAVRLDGMRRQVSASQAVLHGLSCETIHLDRNFRVINSSPRVPQLIKEFFNQDFVGNQLPQDFLDWIRKSLLPFAEHLPLVVKKTEERLTVRLYPQPGGEFVLTLERKRFCARLSDLKSLGLSARQGEVLLWLHRGKTNDEIARILSVSRRTIDHHVHSILQKLALENRTSAAMLVGELIDSS